MLFKSLFLGHFISWVLQTYQPIQSYAYQSFRDMCRSLIADVMRKVKVIFDPLDFCFMMLIVLSLPWSKRLRLSPFLPCMVANCFDMVLFTMF